MPSFTSSSEPSRKLSVASPESRRAALRVLATTLALLAFAVIGARLVLSKVPTEDDDERFHALVRALPTVQADAGRRLVLVLGSSLTEDGFSTLDFDAESAKQGLATTTFNLGVQSATP